MLRDLAAGGRPAHRRAVVDGSGLSLDDRLTAREPAFAARRRWRDPDLHDVLLELRSPVAGESGTLQHRLLDGPARGAVRAKTGTTDIASALSGYASDRFAF